MSKTHRRFRVPLGRIVVLPVGLQPGPGSTNMRHDPGTVVELEVERCMKFDRYLNGRVRAHDLVELGDDEVVEPMVTPAPDVAAAAPDVSPASPPAVVITPRKE